MHFLWVFTLMAAHVYTSPDRALRAVARTSPKGEATVAIEALPKRRLLFRDQTSADGAHGYQLVHAAWTSDSQFFVAGTEATGGHQPWARPIWVYSRAANQIFDLGTLGATAISDFTLTPPDVLQTRGLDCKGPLIISVRQLMATRRAPCPAH